GAGFAGLYGWQIRGGMAPPGLAELLAARPAMTHSHFLAHAILISLMAVATFIDFDEKTIPDWITIPGTVMGLLLAALLPKSLLPINLAQTIDVLLITSPRPWPGGPATGQELGWGLLCLGGWCLAILPRTWTLRRGWLKA